MGKKRSTTHMGNPATAFSLNGKTEQSESSNVLETPIDSAGACDYSESFENAWKDAVPQCNASIPSQFTSTATSSHPLVVDDESFRNQTYQKDTVSPRLLKPSSNEAVQTHTEHKETSEEACASSGDAPSNSVDEASSSCRLSHFLVVLENYLKLSIKYLRKHIERASRWVLLKTSTTQSAASVTNGSSEDASVFSLFVSFLRRQLLMIKVAGLECLQKVRSVWRRLILIVHSYFERTYAFLDKVISNSKIASNLNLSRRHTAAVFLVLGLLFLGCVATVAFTLRNGRFPPSEDFAGGWPREIKLSDCLNLIRSGNIAKVDFLSSSKLIMRTKKDNVFVTSIVPGSEAAMFAFVSSKVPEFGFRRNFRMAQIFPSIAFLVTTYMWWYTFRSLHDPPATKFDFSQAQNDEKITFDDLVSPAVVRLKDVVAYLSHPEALYASGARLPRGILLSGPSGTGKTLLAKAVAGEASVPFLSCSASEFVELYVGRGAHRIRSLFQSARERAPCVVFIDEFDALGDRKRVSMAEGSSEYIQTINQLLTELDGFQGKSDGVVVIAATNRLTAIDAALVRSGRFDRHIVLQLPRLEERMDILKLYIRKKNISVEMDVLQQIHQTAQRTEGFSGADLENLLNESVFESLRCHETTLTTEHIESALANITQQIGASRKAPLHLNRTNLNLWQSANLYHFTEPSPS